MAVASLSFSPPISETLTRYAIDHLSTAVDFFVTLPSTPRRARQAQDPALLPRAHWSMGMTRAVASNTYGSAFTRLGTTPLKVPCGCRASCIGDNLYLLACLNILPCPLGASEGRERSLPCRKEKGVHFGKQW
jgi:hypothetical protein